MIYAYERLETMWMAFISGEGGGCFKETSEKKRNISESGPQLAKKSSANRIQAINRVHNSFIRISNVHHEATHTHTHTFASVLCENYRFLCVLALHPPILTPLAAVWLPNARPPCLKFARYMHNRWTCFATKLFGRSCFAIATACGWRFSSKSFWQDSTLARAHTQIRTQKIGIDCTNAIQHILLSNQEKCFGNYFPHNIFNLMPISGCHKKSSLWKPNKHTTSTKTTETHMHKVGL